MKKYDIAVYQNLFSTTTTLHQIKSKYRSFNTSSNKSALTNITFEISLSFVNFEANCKDSIVGSNPTTLLFVPNEK